MKHMLTIAATAFLACGLVGASASAGDGCNTCDSCSSGKKSFFGGGGGFFHKKSCGGCNDCATPVVQNDCGCDDPCKKKFKFPSFNLFGGGKGCNDCDSCDPCAKKLSLGKSRFHKSDDCGCNDSCSRRLSLPKINFFKRGCGCETSNDCCGGSGGAYGGGAVYGGSGTVYGSPVHSGPVYSAPSSGGVIVHPAPAGTHLAPVPGIPAVKPAPAPAPVPVPAGS